MGAPVQDTLAKDTWSKRRAGAGVVAMLVAYLLAYGAYRAWGPIQMHHSKWGGPPALLINLETPMRATLYYMFYPCVEIEDALARWKHERARHDV